jgi:hypothetical protein
MPLRPLRSNPRWNRESSHFKELTLGQTLPNLESRVIEQYNVAT